MAGANRSRKTTYRALMLILTALFCMLFPKSVPAASYNIWIGNERITDENNRTVKDADGSGTATYDPTKNVLTLNNFNGVKQLHSDTHAMIYTTLPSLTISGSATLKTSSADCICAILSTGNLTIYGKSSNKIICETKGSGIYAEGDLVLQGTIQSTVYNDNVTAFESHKGITIDESAYVYAYATGARVHAIKAPSIKTMNKSYVSAKATGNDASAVLGSEAGTEFQEGSEVIAKASGTGSVGIGGDGNGYIMVSNGASVSAEGEYTAIYSGNGSIVMGNEIEILEPSNGKKASNGKTITDLDLGEPAKKVSLSPPVQYEIWIGETRVTSTNRKDIGGVVGGKASYDPKTKTLSFEGNITGVSALGTVGGAESVQLIVLEENVTITGNASFLDPYADYGIYSYSGSSRIDLTLNGDLKFSGNNTGIYAPLSVVTIDGKTSVTGKNIGLLADTVTITDGSELTSDTKGETDNCFSVKALKMITSSGTLKATASGKNAIAVYAGGGGTGYGSNKTLALSGARIEATASGAGAIAIRSAQESRFNKETSILAQAQGSGSTAFSCKEVEAEDSQIELSVDDQSLTGSTQSYAMNCSSNITLTRSSLNANAKGTACGICALSIYVNSGALSAQAAGAEGVSIQGALKVSAGRVFSKAAVAGIHTHYTVDITGGSLTAEGGDVAVLCDREKEAIVIGEDVAISVPSGGKLNAAQNKILDQDGREAKKITLIGPELYDVWVGKVQVTSKNMDAIPGITGASCRYDPESKTLTFDGYVTGIDGSSDPDITDRAKICAGPDGLNIIMKGKLVADSDSGSHAIDCRGPLTLEGDLTLDGLGVYGADTMLLGKLTGTDSYLSSNILRICEGSSLSMQSGTREITAISTSDRLIIDGGTVTASATGQGNALSSSGKIEINSGTVTLSAKNGGAAIRTADLEINGGTVKATVSNPNPAAVVVYDLGKYTREEFLMRGGVLEVALTDAGSDTEAVVTEFLEQSGGRLTINSSANGLLCPGDLGGVILQGKSLIMKGGDLSVQAQGSCGIRTGNLILEAGNITAKAKDIGLDLTGDSGENSFSGGCLTAGGETMALRAGTVISLKNDMKITEPAGAGVSPDRLHIYMPGTGTDVPSVKIEGPGYYPIWLGDTQITDLNKNDIPGVVGGKAAYDPASNTLTFSGNVTGTKGLHQAGGNYSAVYTEGNLTLDGKASLSSTGYGILKVNSGLLEIKGDLSVSAKQTALSSEGNLIVTGSLAAVSEDGNALSSKKEMIIDKGKVSAEVKNKVNPTLYSEGNMNIRAGYVKAVSPMQAMLTKKAIRLEKAAIVVPAGGKLTSTKNSIVDASDNIAAEVQIEPEYTYYTVTFDTCGHGAAPAAQRIREGGIAVKPADPKAEGFAFGGWYKEKDLMTAYDFSTPVTANLKLFAKWTAVGNTDDADDADPSWILDPKTQIYYRILSVKKKTAALVRPKKPDKKTVSVPVTVKLNGKKYKVVQIDAGAFKDNKKLTKVTIGKNVTKIGKEAFAGCSKLKTILVKTTKLKKKSVGKNAFKGIHKKAKAKVPKKKKTLYRKAFKKAGMKQKTQKIV